MADVEFIKPADDAIVARWLHNVLMQALADTGEPVAICLPGGHTPFPILERLATAGDIDWQRIHIWPGDDRIVPENHKASNIGRIRAIFAPLGAGVTSLTEGAQPPHFALSWLGMGDDGHIASLFPNSNPRADDPQPVRRIMPSPLPPEAPFARLSLTIPALLNCDRLMFVIGAAREPLFRQAMLGGNDLPVARLLAAAQQDVGCFVR